MAAGWGHLARRFVWSLRATPLTSTESDRIRGWIDGLLLDVFFQQHAADQRHGFDSARIVEAHQGRLELIQAALLHDVGKRHAGLGVIGRSLASALAMLRLPTPGRLGRYLRHGALGADEMAQAGAPPIVVEFARSHHDARPDTIDPEDWELLARADSAVIGADDPAR